MSQAVRRAIYGRLAGDTTLTGLLGTAPSPYSQSIYYEQAPEKAGFPFVIFQKQAGTPVYSFKNLAMDDEMWLIKGVDRSTSADGADAVSARLDALLTDATLQISGKALLYLRRESDVDYSETSSGEVYRHAGSLYRVVTS